MRHAARTRRFNRPFNQRKWLMRNLAVSLIEHERITTTLQKAKELRGVVEKAVTLGKKGTLSHRRLLMSRIPNTESVQKIFSVLAPRYSSRSGGYTRILKVMRRPGDNAEMAIIELMDAQLKQVDPGTTKKAAKAKKKLADGPVSEHKAKAAAKNAERKEAKKALKANKAAAPEKKASKPKAKAKSK